QRTRARDPGARSRHQRAHHRHHGLPPPRGVRSLRPPRRTPAVRGGRVPPSASARDGFKPFTPHVETGAETAGNHTKWPEVKEASEIERLALQLKAAIVDRLAHQRSDRLSWRTLAPTA